MNKRHINFLCYSSQNYLYSGKNGGFTSGFMLLEYIQIMLGYVWEYLDLK